MSGSESDIPRQIAALEVREVWLAFRGTPVLEDVNLVVEQGDFLGIIGPNGGGKTVLLKVLLGLLRPDRGSVRVLGAAPEIARGHVAYVPQFPPFDRGFPIRVTDVVRMGRLRSGGVFRSAGADDDDRVREAMYQTGIGGLATRQIGKLSGGQLQRVLIARALAVDASILILDEPAAALDAQTTGQLYGLLGELSEKRTVVMVAHDLSVMYRHVKSVACLNRRLYHHPIQELTQDVLERTYGFPLDVLMHGHRHLGLDDHDHDGPL